MSNSNEGKKSHGDRFQRTRIKTDLKLEINISYIIFVYLVHKKRLRKGNK